VPAATNTAMLTFVFVEVCRDRPDKAASCKSLDAVEQLTVGINARLIGEEEVNAVQVPFTLQ
jgi:hypothetical protein